MPDIVKLIPRILLGVVCLIASHAVFEVLHLCGWYPEQQLAAIVMVSPQTSFWVLSTVAAIGLWAALDYLIYRRKPPLKVKVGDHAGLSSKEQQTEPPQRIALLELLSEAQAKGWVFNRDTLQTFTHDLQQAASEGIVVIWGILKNRRDHKSAPALYVHEEIAASYFTEHWIVVHQGWMHKENRYIATELPSGRNEPSSYLDLQVERGSALAWLDVK